MLKFPVNLVAGFLGAALFTLVAGPLVVPLAGSYINVPSGAIFYFDRTTATGCPVGYVEYTSARGAYIVGLPNGGTKASLVGTALTNLENRTHTHTINASGALDILTGGSTSTRIFATTSGDTWGWLRSDGATRAVSASTAFGTVDTYFAAATHAHGGATGSTTATPAPYLQLLVCQKS